MFDWLVNLSAIFVFNTLGLEKGSHLGEALHFFIYDTIKIFILLVSIIYIVTLLRSYFPIEKARDYISGKNKLVGHVLAAIFGVITPFCSCSAIPLFLGFLQARIPLGVTFSYLISAPLSDAVVIALLFSLFGWKIALLYVGLGLLIAIVAAFLALPFDLKFLSFMQNESIFMFLRLLSFILFMYVAIKVINGKTKKTTKKK